MLLFWIRNSGISYILKQKRSFLHVLRFLCLGTGVAQGYAILKSGLCFHEMYTLPNYTFRDDTPYYLQICDNSSSTF
jgi:hypothetical protein